MQRWDVGMRQALSVDVSKLPPECLNDVVKIVLKRQPENGAEVTIDFNTISEPVCDELRAFVEKSRAESTAKATLESCADGGPCPWIKKDAPPPPEAPPPPSDRPYLLYSAVTYPVDGICYTALSLRETQTQHSPPKLKNPALPLKR